MDKFVDDTAAYFLKYYGNHFPQCDYEEIKHLEPRVECTITTIGFKIDREINPDDIYNSVPDSIVPFKKNHNGACEGNQSLSCKKKSKCMRRSVTFTIKHGENDYKLKIF